MHQELTELLQVLEDPGPLSADLSAALAQVQESLQSHLFARVRTAARSEKQWAQTNPPREAVLLRALIPFLGGNTAQMEQAAQLLTSLSAWQSLQRDLDEVRFQQSAKNQGRHGARASLTMSETGAQPENAPKNGGPDYAQLLLALAFFDRL